MANPTSDDIHADVGVVWLSIVGTTASIVNNQIERAKDDIKDITGTTSGNSQDRAIRYLADAYTVNNAIASLDPSKGNSIYEGIRGDFMVQANKALMKIGKSLDGYSIQFNQVNP